jgi:predicted DNA-binding protein
MYVCAMTTTRRRTNIYLSEGQLKKLKQLSDQTGAPVAEIVRRAIDAYLKEESRGKGAKRLH